MDGIRSEFKILRSEAIWLRQIVNAFELLFDSGKENRNLLAQSASVFFGDLNRLMHEYVIMVICRLTGPDQTAGKDNLTTQRITRLLREIGKVNPEIERLDADLRKYGEMLKPARNKIIAHSDLEVYTQSNALGGHEKQLMVEFLENLQRYFDAVGNAISVGPLDFRNTPARGDALDLVRTLKNANDSRQAAQLAQRDSRTVDWNIDKEDFLESGLLILVQVENPISKRKMEANAIIDTGSNRTGIDMRISTELELKKIASTELDTFQGENMFPVFQGILRIPAVHFAASGNLVGISLDEPDVVIGRDVLGHCGLSFDSSTGRAVLSHKSSR